MKHELVRRRLRALPHEMPEPPAILMPIRVDSPESLFPPRPLAPIRQRPAADPAVRDGKSLPRAPGPRQYPVGRGRDADRDLGVRK